MAVDDVVGRDGFVVLPGLLSAEALDRVRAEADRLLAGEGFATAAFDGSRTRRSYGLLERSRGFDTVLLDPTVGSVVSARLNGPYQLGMFFLTEIHPGQAAQVPHRDASVYPLPRDREVEVNVIWALDDFTENNGATRVVPGSHAWPPDRMARDDEWVTLTMPAGSACVYSGWLLHRAGANTSAGTRRALVIEHVVSWLRPADNHTLGTTRETLRELDPRLAALAGVARANEYLGFVAGQDPDAWLRGLPDHPALRSGPNADDYDLEEDPERASGLCRAAQARLEAALAGLTDDIARGPSRLPGWTVGHVVTHLARNADAHARRLTGALADIDMVKYPDGPGQRGREIEEGAGRPAADLVADLVASQRRLEDVLAACSAAGWPGRDLESADGYPATGCPAHRLREVEVHHADLGVGYGPDNWDEAYVAWDLRCLIVDVPDRADSHRDRSSLLAWVLGRASTLDGVTLGPG